MKLIEKDSGHYTMTWVCSGAATLGFFLGAALYNFQVYILPAEAAVYVSISGAAMFMLFVVLGLRRIIERYSLAIDLMHIIGAIGCIQTAAGFGLMAFDSSNAAADLGLGGFYFLAYWFLCVNIVGLKHAPWPKMLSVAGMAASAPLVVTALGQHLSESELLNAGAVGCMGLVPLWLAGLTAWLMFHDIRTRAGANANVQSESL